MSESKYKINKIEDLCMYILQNVPENAIPDAWKDNSCPYIQYG